MDRPEFGHRMSIASDNEMFPGEHSIDDLAAMVAEIPNRYWGHRAIVSRVRPAGLLWYSRVFIVWLSSERAIGVHDQRIVAVTTKSD